MPPVLGVGVAGVFGTGGVGVGGRGLDEGFQPRRDTVCRPRGDRRLRGGGCGTHFDDNIAAIGQVVMCAIIDFGRVCRGILHGSGGYQNMSGKKVTGHKMEVTGGAVCATGWPQKCTQ